MKKADIVLRQLYRAKVRGRVTIIDLRSEEPGGGWNGVDIATRQPVRIRRAERILCPCNSNGRAIELVATGNGQLATGHGGGATT